MSLLWRACRLWWQHWIGILILNILWFLLQLPIVSGPPATAAFFAMVKRIVDDDVWDARDMWDAWREMFWPAWRWAVPNLLVGVVVVGNFYLYQERTGGMWVTLRLLWGMIALLWLAVNLFYWPFWMHQEDRSLRTTIANALRFLSQHAVMGLLFATGSALLLVLGAALVLPFVFGLVGLVMIGAMLLVQQALKIEKDAKRQL